MKKSSTATGGAGALLVRIDKPTASTMVPGALAVNAGGAEHGVSDFSEDHDFVSEQWVADTGATETRTASAEGLVHCRPAQPGTSVVGVSGEKMQVEMYGDLEVMLPQENGHARFIKLSNVHFVPELGYNLLELRYNLLSGTKTIEACEQALTCFTISAVIGYGEKNSIRFDILGSGLYEICAQRLVSTYVATERALAVQRTATQDIMKMHRLLGHPSEKITIDTAKMHGIQLTGGREPCIGCSKAKAQRHAVPKTTDTRATRKGERIFIDLGGPLHLESLGGSKYVAIFVDDCTRFKVTKFIEEKSDAVDALKSFIADYITPQGLKIVSVRTDNGGEFEGDFQRHLDALGIRHECTPPHTPQYNGVAERALGLLREKAIAMMEDVPQEYAEIVNIDRLWTEAMSFATDMSNRAATTSITDGTTPYGM